MPTQFTPGVQVIEKDAFAPSVAPVSTAVPAFVGCTSGGSLRKPKLVESVLDYEHQFGSGEPPSGVDYTFRMHQAIELYFENGGAPCYVVSAGRLTAAPTKQNFIDAIDALKAEDDPTILVIADAVGLAGVGVASAKKAAAAAKKAATAATKDAAAAKKKADAATKKAKDAEAAVKETADAAAERAKKVAAAAEDKATEAAEAEEEAKKAASSAPTNAKQSYYDVCTHALGHCAELSDRFAILDVLEDDADGSGFRGKIGMNDLDYGAAYTPFLQLAEDTFPPSAAVAAVYCTVDNDRGVWKAPANVSINGVLGPARLLTDAEQAPLNVDANTGKSINAIRAFTGKGTLVWGARTLAGNDNNWRYISVRRLFIYLEESIKKASAWAVFEANSPSTWLKLKALIEAFLHEVWQQGGLVGNSAEEAYFVAVGLPQTMDEDDIREGRLKITVGASPARPAEFITITFTQKMEKS